MCTFCCTTCGHRIKEYNTEVDCEIYGLDYPMVEDTTKLYDKSFLCAGYSRRKINDITCKNKRIYSYKYDALRNAWKIQKKDGKILRPYRCNICGKWHLTTYRGVFEYDPTEEYLKATKANKLYD